MSSIAIYALNDAIWSAFHAYASTPEPPITEFNKKLLWKLCQKCNANANITQCTTFNCVVQFVSVDGDISHFVILIRVFEGNMDKWKGINYTLIGHMEMQKDGGNCVIDNLMLLTHIGMGYVSTNNESYKVSFYGNSDVTMFPVLHAPITTHNTPARELVDTFVYGNKADFVLTVFNDEVTIFNGGPEDARLYIDNTDNITATCYVTPNTFVKVNTAMLTETVCLIVKYNKITHAFTVDDDVNFIEHKQSHYNINFKNVIARNKFDSDEWSVTKNTSLFGRKKNIYMMAWGYDKPFGIYKLNENFDVDPPLNVVNQTQLNAFSNILISAFGGHFGKIKLRGGSNPCIFDGAADKYVAVGHIVLEYRNPLAQYCVDPKPAICENATELKQLQTYFKSKLNHILNPCINDNDCSNYYDNINRLTYFKEYFKLYMTFFYTFKFVNDDDIEFCEISNFTPLPSENISEAITFPTGLSRNGDIFYLSYGIADDRTSLMQINLERIQQMLVPLKKAKLFKNVRIDINGNGEFPRKNEISYKLNKLIYKSIASQ